jgi:hypothetical protein
MAKNHNLFSSWLVCWCCHGVFFILATEDTEIKNVSKKLKVKVQNCGIPTSWDNLLNY